MSDRRAHAVSLFDREWETWLRQSVALQATSKRLSDALELLAAEGSHQTLVMPDEMSQRWWLAYQGKRDALEAPSMRGEDELVAEVTQLREAR